MNTSIANQDKYKKLIIGLSVAVPLAIVALFGVKIEGYDFSFLPPIYATINGITAILLLSALWAIKNKRRLLHEKIMKVCLFLSASFLIMYMLYHMTSDPTSYGGEGGLRFLYFTILASHILLSIVVVPLVLFTYTRAWFGNFDGHKKIARITFPIWFYVAVTGVIIYLMISPYYV